MCLCVNLSTYTEWAKKIRTCFSVDNLAMVTCRKACDMSKVLEYCRQKGPNLHSKSFQYSLPNFFTRESRMLHAPLPSSGRPSVCPSVRDTRELYQNGAS